METKGFRGFAERRRDPLKGQILEDPHGIEARLLSGKYDPPEFQALNYEAQRLRAKRLLGLTTLGQLRSKIEVLPHQVQCALRVLNEMQSRAILADEVGLGKTIEAGIIMKELIARGKAKTILVLTPASLSSQWQQELWEKFGERFIKHDDPEFLGFDKHDHIVSSIDTAKSPQHQAAILGRGEWDLVIIDEAHYLKNKKTQRYALADEISARHALMLTATPIQNNLMELYNLINLIAPALLGSMQEFEQEYVGDAQGRILLHATELQKLLKRAMIRNRRSETSGIKFPVREVETKRIKASAPEYDLQRSVSKFIRDFKRSFESHLGLLILEREVASSSFALAKTLDNMTVKHTDVQCRMAMQDLKEKALALTKNSKAEVIMDLAKGTKDKMIVFTQFRETQDFLARQMEDAGVSYIKYHGQLNSRQRRLALESFRDGGIQVLLATDSGSEGLNLQFCHILVNYDLPWNPMRVEQRIGRIHRIGQMSDTVYILNLALADTIEDYVLQVLYEKIKLFEVAIGEMDLILSDVNEGGGLEKKILDAILSTEDDADIKTSLGKVEAEVRRGRANAEEVKKLDAQVFSQFDLSTADRKSISDLTVDFDGIVEEFIQHYCERIGAKRTEADGLVTIEPPREHWKRIGNRIQYTRHQDVFEDNEGRIEFLGMSSKIVQDAIAHSEALGAMSAVYSPDIGTPQIRLVYRIDIQTLRHQTELYVTVVLDEAGRVLQTAEEIAMPTLGAAATGVAIEPATVAKILEQGKTELGLVLDEHLTVVKSQIQEELREIHKRLQRFFQSQDETERRDYNKLTRKHTEANRRVLMHEGTAMQRRAEEERDKAENDLHEFRNKMNRMAEKRQEEFEEKYNKEVERRNARVQLDFVGATYLVPT